MSGDSLERYGGMLAAPARTGWRTVLDVIGVLDLIAAAVLAVILTQHGAVLGCQTLTPPGGSEQVAVAFSPDGRMLAFGTANHRVDVWNVPTGPLIATLTAPDGGAVSGVAFSPHSRTLAFADDSDHAYLCSVSG